MDASTCHLDAAADICRAMWFVEPLGWMPRVGQRHSGKLHCPKCTNKVGSFNWIMGTYTYSKTYPNTKTQPESWRVYLSFLSVH